MVREVRFSREDAGGAELPDRRDRFDELDDFLDDFVPTVPAEQPAPHPAGCKGTGRRTAPSARHLAGADWLRDPSVALSPVNGPAEEATS